MNIENGRSKERELNSSKQRSQEIVEMCVTRDIRKKKTAVRRKKALLCLGC